MNFVNTLLTEIITFGTWLIFVIKGSSKYIDPKNTRQISSGQWAGSGALSRETQLCKTVIL